MPELYSPLLYADADIRRILSSTHNIALVGASENWNRPSHYVMDYMQKHGWRVIPVNPALAGKSLLGEVVRGTLDEIAAPVDLVQIFRRSEFVGEVVDQLLALKAKGAGIKYIWMQQGVRDDDAARRAEAAGLTVIMDRCTKIEVARLGLAPDPLPEIDWTGPEFEPADATTL